MQIHRIAGNNSSPPDQDSGTAKMSTSALDPDEAVVAITSCPHCGFTFDGEFRYCGNCGKPLAATARRAVPAVPHVATEPTEPPADLPPRLGLRALAMIPHLPLRCGWR